MSDIRFVSNFAVSIIFNKYGENLTDVRQTHS